MNKKYIDFVPAKNARSATHKKTAQSVAKKKTVSRPVAKKTIKTTSAAPSNTKLGVVENLSPKATSRTSNAHFVVSKGAVKAAKAKKVGVKAPEEKPKEKPKKNASDTYKTPKTPFVNQDKVKKRPLSKNVYRKEVKPVKEDAAPVTIITKPEKDARISLIVTIILTIILGAAAGTVAFLLLPK